MTDRDTTLRTYLKAFFKDMLTGMSGPLSVPFAGLAIWVSSAKQKALWGSLAVVCALFASYRVWRDERKSGTALLQNKDAESADLRERLARATREFKLEVTVDGEPPSQTLRFEADHNVELLRVEYMLASEAVVAREETARSGTSFGVPVNDALVLKVWNTPRPDRNAHDHSGPAKIGLTVRVGSRTRHYVLPVQMRAGFKDNTAYRELIGAKTFLDACAD